MRENHLLAEGPLLDEKGDLVEAGYANRLVKAYDKSKIGVSKLRLKEWDYYYVGSSSFGLALTIADNGYMSLLSVTVVDFERRKEYSKTKIGLFPMGKLNLPPTSEIGDIRVKGKGYDFSFAHEDSMRRLTVYMSEFKGKESFHCDIYLKESNADSLVIATPFRKRGHFYYNQKINNLVAHGYCSIGKKEIDFNLSSFGVLDWGRGVWTYRNTWYWSSLSAYQNGHYIGWNLGYGFGDSRKASENILYLDGKSFKIGDIRMNIPLARGGRDDFMKEWRIKDCDGFLDLTFTPIYDRHSDTNLLFLRSNQHQIFGKFSGKMVFEEKEIEIENALGFAEKVFNKW